MKSAIFLLFMSLLIISCGDKPVAETNSDTPSGVSVQSLPDSISPITFASDTTHLHYRFDEGEQHNWIHITRISDSAYGDLHYTWEGKDGANGNFTGRYSGDTLWILFTANMEGNEVIQEMAFLHSGELLLEGQAMLDDDAKGVLRIKHRSLIEFSTRHAMKRTIPM